MCPCNLLAGVICDYHRREKERQNSCCACGRHTLDCYTIEPLDSYRQREEVAS